MRIGFISGDLVEVTTERTGVSVPDYPVQGFLLEKLKERGHEIVLLTRVPKSVADRVPFSYDPGGNANEHDLDVLLGDRLGPYGAEYEENTLRQLEEYTGPIVFHQYIATSGWAPQFREMPHLLGHQRQWTIVNRSLNPRLTYHTVSGWKEAITDSLGVVLWRRWEPFLMLEYPWMGEYVTPELIGPRPYAQGYYGRLPKRERRVESVERWLTAGAWPRIVYGPETSTAWMSQATGAVNGGRIQHKDLPQMLTTFNCIVQSPIDRLQNKGKLEYWPHRIVECALAGVLQLFDTGMGIPEFRPWEVRTDLALRSYIEEVVYDLRALQHQVRLQQDIILPHAVPSKVLDRLEEILEEAASR